MPGSISLSRSADPPGASALSPVCRWLHYRYPASERLRRLLALRLFQRLNLSPAKLPHSNICQTYVLVGQGIFRSFWLGLEDRITPISAIRIGSETACENPTNYQSKGNIQENAPANHNTATIITKMREMAITKNTLRNGFRHYPRQ